MDCKVASIKTVWIHCADYICRHHGPRGSEEKECWRKSSWLLLLSFLLTRMTAPSRSSSIFTLFIVSIAITLGFHQITITLGIRSIAITLGVH
nr:hypothetical protein Iba_chr11eCG13910 [Ipomoea batatas]